MGPGVSGTPAAVPRTADAEAVRALIALATARLLPETASIAAEGAAAVRGVPPIPRKARRVVLAPIEVAGSVPGVAAAAAAAGARAVAIGAIVVAGVATMVAPAVGLVGEAAELSRSSVGAVLRRTGVLAFLTVTAGSVLVDPVGEEVGHGAAEGAAPAAGLPLVGPLASNLALAQVGLAAVCTATVVAARAAEEPTEPAIAVAAHVRADLPEVRTPSDPQVPLRQTAENAARAPGVEKEGPLVVVAVPALTSPRTVAAEERAVLAAETVPRPAACTAAVP